MSHTVKLSSDLIESARIYAAAQGRSIPRQIEYWAKIGRIAADNPDLPMSFIEDILLSMAEAEEGKLTPYKFGV